MRADPPSNNSATRPDRGWWLAAAVVPTLALLLAHGLYYRFLTDDAFISFRYARHLAMGQGLVFNPGGERVEGYSNFLWVLILAALDRVGVAPETSSQLLGFGLTVALWGLVLVWVRRDSRDGAPVWLPMAPLLFLGATRSVAVWTTGGLETRLYEVLILGAALTLVWLIETPGGARRPPLTDALPGLLFGLAALTRPDGPLVGGCAFAVALAALARRGGGAWRRLASPCAVFAVLVASHYLFRRLYYDDWLPNTWYAKVGGTTWWTMGAKYFALFALEYAAFLWAPLLAGAAVLHFERGTGHRFLLVAAMIVPHALFVASVGGDHFEYRPLDLYFPFLFILMHDGARRFSRGALSSALTAAYLTLVLAGLVAVPWLSAATFPKDAYRGGFPGGWPPGAPPASTFLSAGHLGPYSLPGLRWLGEDYAALLRETTASFVGLRAEEHAGFLGTVVGEGRALERLVAGGILPPDTHVAIDCVGAIPYYSGLITLDRLGLNDRRVARSASAGQRLMAHEKKADVGYARGLGVDFWAMDNVHLVWNPEAPRFIGLVKAAYRQQARAYVADLHDGSYLLVYLLQGPEAAGRRFPRLEFLSLRDADTVERLLAPAESGKP